MPKPQGVTQSCGSTWKLPSASVEEKADEVPSPEKPQDAELEGAELALHTAAQAL